LLIILLLAVEAVALGHLLVAAVDTQPPEVH
jgi:hypothetical protein